MKALHLNLIILIFCVSLFSFGAGKLGLEFKGDENFYFVSAKGMLKTGDVLTPRYMGEERFQKPILFYWLILASFKILGVSWFAARLPSIIFGALCAYMIFAISNLFFKDVKIGLFAALFSATAPIYYRYARLAVPDMALLFFVTLALYYFARCYKNSNPRGSVLLFFAAAALAFLLKGPIGIVLPLLVIGIFSFVVKKKGFFGAANLMAGIVIFFLITAPWFFFIYEKHGDTYLNHIWTREFLQRLGHGHTTPFVLRSFKAFFFYAGVLITKFFPYSLIAPFALVESIRALSPGRSGAVSESERYGYIFLTLWIAVVFLFFSFVAEKRAHYLLALSPPLFILVSSHLRNNRIVRPGLVWGLAMLYIALSFYPPIGFFNNKMERAAKSIKSEFKEGDIIGIGSHGIIPEELQVYFEGTVKNVKVTYNPDGTPDRRSASPLLKYLRSDEKVFCVMKKKDYDTFIPAEAKKDLYLLDSYYVWKRRIKFDRHLKGLFSSVNSKGIREIFQNEIYVLSNKKK